MDTAIRRHPAKDHAANPVIGHEGATTMNASKRLARSAGLLYLLIGIFGGFAQSPPPPPPVASRSCAPRARSPAR